MVKIHFRYGSRPRRKYPNQKKMFGGILGGHVYFQVDNFFYGFEPKEERALHFYPRKAYNAIFKKESESEFLTKHQDQKVLTIDLRLTAEQETKLLHILELYHASTPYDYAVFGMRCGASSYHILSMIGVFPPRSSTQALLAIPYPKFLRKKLLHFAKANGLKLVLTEGTAERVWESD